MADTRTPTRPVRRAVTLAAVADVAAVLVFAAVGRSSHAEGVTAAGVLETAAPFLLGLLVGWLAGRLWRAPLALPLGVLGWAGTVVVGLAVRAAFTHRLPVSFVLVAAVSLAVFLLGWRAVALLVTRATRAGHRSN
ncbi:MAG: hypothetical protein QOH45_1027 [Pseudonocardiales bacterium]|nr:hypothetical protein [Pseudonocardiales bacterium]